MRHNHKNHIGSPCRFVDVFDVLPNWKNRNPHRSPKSEKPRCFCQKTENQMLKKGKTGNHNGQQNRKTEVFHCKNRKSQGPPSRREGFLNFLSQKRRGGGGRPLRYELITKPGMALDINSFNLSAVLGVKQPLMQRYLI